MKLTLYKKLLFSFLIVLLLLSAISATALTKMHTMGAKSKQTTDTGLPNVVLLANLNHDLMELDDLMLRIQLNLEDATSQDLTSDRDFVSQPDKAKQTVRENRFEVAAAWRHGNERERCGTH
ncbi:MCP four helix bundle domain-containing protein [Paenibacillus sp. P26]|nr:MCP four helix bundle domain-containing protein [Paenibacillus sp. P26]